MIRSTNQTLGEYDLIRRPEHVALVWASVEETLPKYWSVFLERERSHEPINKLAVKFGNSLETNARVLTRAFDDALQTYKKESEKYRPWFEAETMDEFRDDPNAFKQTLAREVPIIANTLRQRRAELKDWQVYFHETRANALLQVFSNIMDFREDWYDAHPTEAYNLYDEPAAFGLDPLDDDESMGIESVIGMGIKSIVLYHLDPKHFPARGQNALYGMYFLSGKKDFGLPSRSTEFLMINDVNTQKGCMLMDHNYWYPYGLFSLYVLRIFKWLEAHALQEGITLNPSFRFVYVERFFASICHYHEEDLKTMRAHERFAAPL